MKRVTLSVLAAGIACLAATTTYAYDKATVFNTAHYSAAIIVRYSACKPDSFTVPAATVNGPGQATASSNRGACLITSVNAVLNSSTHKVADYTSSGTSYSRFLIRYMGGATPYKIYSDHELANLWDREKDNKNSPEGDFSKGSDRGGVGLLANCQRDAQATMSATKDRLAAAGNKLTPAQQASFEATRKSLLPSGTASLENCKARTIKIAAWKADVDKALGTTK